MTHLFCYRPTSTHESIYHRMEIWRPKTTGSRPWPFSYVTSSVTWPFDKRYASHFLWSIYASTWHRLLLAFSMWRCKKWKFLSRHAPRSTTGGL